MEDKGFFGALFDMSFSEFVTIKLIRILYILHAHPYRDRPCGGYHRKLCQHVH